VRKSLVLIAAAVALVPTGCSAQLSADDFSRAEVDGIATKCGAPRTSIKLNAGWVVVRDASENDRADFCVLNEIKRTGKKHVSIVANQLHSKN
jgi:hypothetical protein